MQTKKEEIKQTILEAAKKEFLIHGYEGASMRVIASKANTTLGNIYHYYKNKEGILDVLLEEPIHTLQEMVNEHTKLQDRLYTAGEILDSFGTIEDIAERQEMQCLMDERLIILFDLKTTRYVKIREEIVDKVKKHLAWHLSIENENSAYLDIVADMFISCVRHFLMGHKDMESRKEFVKCFRMLCTGLATDLD